MSNTALHQPVMLQETIEALAIQPHQWYVDATFGRGGHTEAILARQARVIAFDWDQAAINWAKRKFASHLTAGKLILVKASFAQLEAHFAQLQTEIPDLIIDGILFDFGTSADQLLSAKRGFSFNHPNSPLDMRMDQTQKLTAADLLNLMTEHQLTELFFKQGGEPQARIIAKKIVMARKTQAFSTTGQLLTLIQQVKKQPRGHLHPATKVFQALRIAVNQELKQISQALPQALAVLQPGGRIITIAFHEGEDRLAKVSFRQWQQQRLGQTLTKKPLTPSEQELRDNPRARSAKLRIFEKA